MLQYLLKLCGHSKSKAFLRCQCCEDAKVSRDVPNMKHARLPKVPLPKVLLPHKAKP